MQTRKFDELISYFNRKVSSMVIDQKYKMELLGMITAIGIAHEKEVNAPTIEPERKKGKWDFEEYPDGYYHSECSICGSWFKEDAFLNPYNFCPNCGSDMRGGRADG